MKEIRHLETIKKKRKKKERNLNTKRHLLQNDQNVDTTLLYSPDNIFQSKNLSNGISTLSPNTSPL